MKQTAQLKPKPRPKSTCSLLCYLAADNDLSSFSLMDVEEASRSGTPPKVHIGLELDTLGNMGSIRYEITKPDFEDRGYRTVVERLPEQDSGSFITLRNFLDWGIKRSDARQRFVVIWGHGMGNAIAPDFQSMGESMSVPRLVEAFYQAGLGDPAHRREPNWSGRNEGPVAVLGFDACNMASIENIWGVRHVAQMVIASQEKVPATGWPYEDLVQAQRRFRGSKPASDKVLREIGEHVVNAYIESYNNMGITAITLSAVRTNNGLEKLVAQTNKLGKQLATAIGKEKPRNAPVTSACMDARLYAQGFHLGDFTDLAHFAYLFGNDARVKKTKLAKAARDLSAAIKGSDAIISQCGVIRQQPLLEDVSDSPKKHEECCDKPDVSFYQTSPIDQEPEVGEPSNLPLVANPEVADAHGLSIWFPAQRPRYLSRRRQYEVDNGDEFAGWVKFLDAFYA